MESWNLKELKDLIMQVYGQSQLDLVEQSIDSMGLRQDFAAYHYQEYRTLYDKLQTEWAVSKTWTIKDLEESHVIEIKMAANILACLQNLHSVHDILGQVIRYTFDLQFEETKPVYLNNVKDKLKQYKNLFKLLSELIDHEDYKYLNAFMNQSKHNAVVVPYYQTLNSSDGVKLPAFRHKNKEYIEKNAEIFLVALYARESNLLVSIGQEINKFLDKAKM